MAIVCFIALAFSLSAFVGPAVALRDYTLDMAELPVKMSESAFPQLLQQPQFDNCSHQSPGCERTIRGSDVPVVVMLSGTGEGKSTLTCDLSRDPGLAGVAVEHDADSSTLCSCVYHTSWFFPYDRSEKVDIIDTPGFGDTRGEAQIRKNNANIVNTLQAAGRINVIMWVLDANRAKQDSGRTDAFRFVRAYFGKAMYKHLVFVYRQFQWRKPRGKKVEIGKEREGSLKLLHNNTITNLLRDVESEFWPEKKVTAEVENAMHELPFFGLNIFTGQEGGFEDGDMTPDMYEDTDPDGYDGVFNDDKTFKPNSASALRDLKAQILKIAKFPSLDVSKMRPLAESCDKVVQSTLNSDVTEVGHQLLDCVKGQLYRTLVKVVVPHFQNLDNGLFVAFAIRQAEAANAADGEVPELAKEARKVLGLSPDLLETANNFKSMAAYSTCKNLEPRRQSPTATATALSACLQGIAEGKKPLEAEAMRGRFTDPKRVLPEDAEELLAAVEQLQPEERAIILQGPHKIDLQKLVSRRLTISVIYEGRMTNLLIPFDLQRSSHLADISARILGTAEVKSLIPSGAQKILTIQDSRGGEIGNDEDVQTLWTGKATATARIDLITKVIKESLSQDEAVCALHVLAKHSHGNLDHVMKSMKNNCGADVVEAYRNKWMRSDFVQELRRLLHMECCNIPTTGTCGIGSHGTRIAMPNPSDASQRQLYCCPGDFESVNMMCKDTCCHMKGFFACGMGGRGYSYYRQNQDRSEWCCLAGHHGPGTKCPWQ